MLAGLIEQHLEQALESGASMTLTMAWVRKLKNQDELVIVSDSRLRSGMAWDSCPKLFTTPRGDICFGFAGDTMYAYPLIVQAINQMSLHRASMTRELEVHDAKGHLKRVFRAMLDARSDFSNKDDKPEIPETLFLMAGYSWKLRRFQLWKVRFDVSADDFVWARAGGVAGLGVDGQFVVLGNPTMNLRERRRLSDEGKQVLPEEKDVRMVAMNRLVALVQQRQEPGKHFRLNMEPFEVLCSMIEDEVSPYVSGPPQVIKMYPSCSSQIVGVRWPPESATSVSVGGRPLLDYEELDCPIIDPKTLDCGMDFWRSRKARLAAIRNQRMDAKTRTNDMSDQEEE